MQIGGPKGTLKGSLGALNRLKYVLVIEKSISIYLCVRNMYMNVLECLCIYSVGIRVLFLLGK